MFLFLLLAALSSDPAVFVRSLYEADQRGAADPVYGIHSRAELLKTFEGPIVDRIWRDLVDAQGVRLVTSPRLFRAGGNGSIPVSAGGGGS